MSESDIEIELQPNANGGRYVTTLDGGPEAEMTFRTVDDNTIAIDHTFVPNEYRGQGIAKHLFDKAISDAQANNTKIVPVCSYVAAQFRRQPELKHLLAS